jgi:phosphomevalonate decarboxylase
LKEPLILSKATAIAHTIQGLIKYHGLKDKKRRIPYHDSISVCVEALTTTATIEFGNRAQDVIDINGKRAAEEEAERILAVTSALKKLAKTKDHFKLSTVNNVKQGKGLGFSASAFAAVALASSTALGLNLERKMLSEFARLGAGSASRSLVGGFAIWYANRNGRSYARQLASGDRVKLAMAIVPISSPVKTDMAHRESVTSPFFESRVKTVVRNLKKMQYAIQKGDVEEVAKLAEADSLSLHAVTMTGEGRLLLMAPGTVSVIKRIESMRETDHIPVWYSLDTGPSVYINTRPEFVDEVCSEIRASTNLGVIKSGVGGPARTIEEHLF